MVAADSELLAATAAELGLPLSLELYNPTRQPKPHRNGILQVMHIPTSCRVVAGQPDPRNAAYVIEMLNRACDGCTNGEFAAMVTAPVQKSTLMDAGYRFSGHTEYLAERTRAALPVMLLLNDDLRVALVTTHLALADVPRAITRERLRATLRIVNMDLERHFSLAPPRIAVLGLNPHAWTADSPDLAPTVGKLADLLVLDRDYLTIPVEQIKDIKPLITMVAGRIVYDADASVNPARPVAAKQ